ncbi:PilZ domain-containing protein [Desulfogranum mediterraneum]|uniref:PilZ domain-containing protein n=1 Tax=Desulfogranum mediterraneum TaxID=160661 RepID=UPI0004251E65|nr:PilZ domain-containing protein [Desulfogranum mediterraneum]
MPSEKRKFSRIHLNFSLTLTLADGSAYLIDTLDDIAIGGCLIPAQAEYARQGPCHITIPLGDSPEAQPRIEVEGEIIRVTPEQVAICFNQIEPESLVHLQNLIRYNAPDPDKIEEEINQHPGLL